MNKPEEQNITIDLVNGEEGQSLYLMGHRIAGNKPWGGGAIAKTFNTTIEEILLAIATNQPESSKTYHLWYNFDYEVTIKKLKEK